MTDPTNRAPGEVPAKLRVYSFVAEIDEAELTLRILVIAIGLRPPEGKSAAEAVNDAERRWLADPLSGPFPFRRMARAAIEYLGECIEKGQQPS